MSEMLFDPNLMTDQSPVIQITVDQLEALKKEYAQAGEKRGRQEAYERTLKYLDSGDTCCRAIHLAKDWLESRIS